jgi:predicted ABC-type ATPase
MAVLYVVAGPNGAGKTTMFNSVIPSGVDYINGDLVVKSVREQAGGLNVQDIANHEVAKLFYSKIEKKESFAIETNLCDLETYKSFIGVQGLGYEVNILFLSVDQVEICIDRVNLRVSRGGHNVNPDVVRSRYITGLKLLGHYKYFPDRLVLLDNSLGSLDMQAELHKGLVYFQAGQISEWVKNILTGPTSPVPPATSIEEVRKRYKKKD